MFMSGDVCYIGDNLLRTLVLDLGKLMKKEIGKSKPYNQSCLICE